MKEKFIILLLLIYGTVLGQKTINPFQMVMVPDSISLSLEKVYPIKNVNSGKNVYNLSNRKNFNFVNGIYSFQGQGPHFPRSIFIYNERKIYIFCSDGASNAKGILKEYLEATDYLNLNNKAIVSYLQIISIYLKDELGNTYGAVIKN